MVCLDAMADEGYRVFVVRMHREGPSGRPRWRGVVELVGSETRRAVAGAHDVADFIERWLEHTVEAPAERSGAGHEGKARE